MANAAEKNSADTQRDLAAAMSTLASRPAPTGKRPLTGRERAAVLMLALGEQYGAKIWGMLDDDELRELSVAMSAIGAIEADVVENLLLEFVTRMSASGALMGSYEATERLCNNTCRPSGSARSWSRSAAPPAATCGTSSPTCRKRCSPTISRTSTRKLSRSCSPRSGRSTPHACSRFCPRTSRSMWSTACCAWRRCRKRFSSASS
jgi:hypothetical protein